jgi:hypothetical protein
METVPPRGSTETANVASAPLQKNRFNERKLREAETVTRSEAVYFSPVLKFDAVTSVISIQYRDSKTGEVQNEYPTPKQLESYRKSAETTPAPVVVEKAPSKVPEGKSELVPVQAVKAEPAPRPESDSVKVEEKVEKRPVEHEKRPCGYAQQLGETSKCNCYSNYSF